MFIVSGSGVIREDGVAAADRRADLLHRHLPEEPRLAALGVDVRVCAEERRERRRLREKQGLHFTRVAGVHYAGCTGYRVYTTRKNGVNAAAWHGGRESEGYKIDVHDRYTP